MFSHAHVFFLLKVFPLLHFLILIPERFNLLCFHKDVVNILLQHLALYREYTINGFRIYVDTMIELELAHRLVCLSGRRGRDGVKGVLGGWGVSLF